MGTSDRSSELYKMTFQRVPAIAAISAALFVGAAAQTAPPQMSASPAPKIASALAEKLGSFAGMPDASRENRQLAYAKMLEGQRYLWSVTNSRRTRTQSTIAANTARA